jgi:hypothetical protein
VKKYSKHFNRPFVSQNKTYKWPTGVWKNAEHFLSGKYKLKAQTDITLEWLL